MLINEKIKPLEPKLPKQMIGKVCIDLHNHNSGFTERIEGENLVTNAVNTILPQLFVNSDFNTTQFPIYSGLLGGLMLFDGALTENVNNIHFPTNVHLVGSAGQTENISQSFRGSLNSAESMEVTGGYKTVWDFGTAQCNGTIASLSRTHRYAGVYPGMVDIDNVIRNLFSMYIYNANFSLPHYLDGSTLYMVRYENSLGKRFHYPTVQTMDFEGKIKVNTIAGSLGVPLDDNISWTQGRHYPICDPSDPLHRYNIEGTNNNTTVYRATLDPNNNYAVTEDAITISTSNNGYCCVSNGIVYGTPYGASAITTVFKVSLSDPTNVTIYTLDGMSTETDGQMFVPLYGGGVTINPERYVSAILYEDGHISYYGANSGENDISNANNAKARAYASKQSTSGGIYLYNAAKKIHYSMEDTSYTYQGLRTKVEGNYLGTIFNLQTPVTKTAAQSMKITYTLLDA